MHNSFNLQQYICYITLLNMFRAARCSSSGRQILSPQPLVSSPSVSSRTIRGWIIPLNTEIRSQGQYSSDYRPKIQASETEELKIFFHTTTEKFVTIYQNTDNSKVSTPFSNLYYVLVYFKLKVAKIILEYESRYYSHKNPKGQQEYSTSVFLTLRHSIDFSKYQLRAQFF